MKEVVRSVNSSKRILHVSWIESHATSVGFPDIDYCCYGVEGHLELKAGPDIDVLASQIIWMRERIAAGGHPLFLVQWGDVYIVVPGSWAVDIRRNPSEENILRRGSTMWHGSIPPAEFLKVLRNPRQEYERANASSSED